MFKIKGYLPRKTVMAAAEILKDYKGMIADIACGKGVLLKEVRQKDKNIFGIDIAPNQLMEAKAAGMPVVEGDIFSIPFKGGIFDIAVCINAIYNFPTLSELKPVFKEMARIIKKDGRIVLDIRNKRNPILKFKYWRHNRKKTFPVIPCVPEDLESIMNKIGCKYIERHIVGVNNPYLAWGYIMVFKKGDDV